MIGPATLACVQTLSNNLQFYHADIPEVYLRQKFQLAAGDGSVLVSLTRSGAAQLSWMIDICAQWAEVVRG